MESGFIATDSHLAKFFLPNNREEISDHLFGRKESPNLFGLNHDMPGPAEKAFQKTSYTVCRGNSSIKGSRTKSVIFSLLSRANDLSSPFGQYERINKRAIHTLSFNKVNNFVSQ
jgi:hypothetical protein